jgi:septation ring formation regulator EzrA
MKTSTQTGKHIYESINALLKEITELEKALDTIADEIGQGSLPYSIIEKQRVEKAKQLSELYRTNYEISVHQGGF